MSLASLEPLFTRIPRGLMSRLRVFGYKCLGMKAGNRNRLESIRCRRLNQIELGNNNSLQMVAGSGRSTLLLKAFEFELATTTTSITTS